MTAVTERPLSVIALAPDDLPAGECARALAQGYLRYASACWRGDTAAPAFGVRLGAYWRPELPPEPMSGPDAVSPHGAAGRGIRWHQNGDEVIGYIPGAHGGYEVPVAAIPRLVRCAPAHPCEVRAASA